MKSSWMQEQNIDVESERVCIGHRHSQCSQEVKANPLPIFWGGGGRGAYKRLFSSQQD